MSNLPRRPLFQQHPFLCGGTGAIAGLRHQPEVPSVADGFFQGADKHLMAKRLTAGRQVERQQLQAGRDSRVVSFLVLIERARTHAAITFDIPDGNAGNPAEFFE